MEKSAPSRLANLRELVSLLSLSVQIQTEVSKILEEYEIRLYAVEETTRLYKACYERQSQQISSLEKRYSEVLYKLSELKNG